MKINSFDLIGVYLDNGAWLITTASFYLLFEQYEEDC
ncbi:hypothetical protein FB2170_15268 [Maribacter sp. HTCC2170]|nr:hypothetical protein FB2170_15268 [Maribacter sp. HTCC2170]